MDFDYAAVNLGPVFKEHYELTGEETKVSLKNVSIKDSIWFTKDRLVVTKDLVHDHNVLFWYFDQNNGFKFLTELNMKVFMNVHELSFKDVEVMTADLAYPTRGEGVMNVEWFFGFSDRENRKFKAIKLITGRNGFAPSPFNGFNEVSIEVPYGTMEDVFKDQVKGRLVYEDRENGPSLKVLFINSKRKGIKDHINEIFEKMLKVMYARAIGMPDKVIFDLKKKDK